MLDAKFVTENTRNTEQNGHPPVLYRMFKKDSNWIQGDWHLNPVLFGSANQNYGNSRDLKVQVA